MPIENYLARKTNAELIIKYSQCMERIFAEKQNVKQILAFCACTDSSSEPKIITIANKIQLLYNVKATTQCYGFELQQRSITYEDLDWINVLKFIEFPFLPGPNNEIDYYQIDKYISVLESDNLETLDNKQIIQQCYNIRTILNALKYMKNYFDNPEIITNQTDDFVNSSMQLNNYINVIQNYKDIYNQLCKKRRKKIRKKSKLFSTAI